MTNPKFKFLSSREIALTLQIEEFIQYCISDSELAREHIMNMIYSSEKTDQVGYIIAAANTLISLSKKK